MNLTREPLLGRPTLDDLVFEGRKLRPGEMVNVAQWKKENPSPGLVRLKPKKPSPPVPVTPGAIDLVHHARRIVNTVGKAVKRARGKPPQERREPG